MNTVLQECLGKSNYAVVKEWTGSDAVNVSETFRIISSKNPYLLYVKAGCFISPYTGDVRPFKNIDKIIADCIVYEGLDKDSFALLQLGSLNILMIKQIYLS